MSSAVHLLQVRHDWIVSLLSTVGGCSLCRGAPLLAGGPAVALSAVLPPQWASPLCPLELTDASVQQISPLQNNKDWAVNQEILLMEKIISWKTSYKLTMGLFLCWSYGGALGLLCEASLRCTGDCRGAGPSVCWGAAVSRKRSPVVRSLCHQLLLWAYRFSFPSLPRTRPASKSCQPRGPSSSLVLGDICESFAWPAASYIMVILCWSEVFLSAGCRLGTVSLGRSVFIWLLVGQSFCSSGLRLFAWFYWTSGLIHPSCPAALVPGGVNTTVRMTGDRGHLKSR